MHLKNISLDKNAKRIRDIFHKKQFLFMNSYHLFVDFVNIFSIISLAISNNQKKVVKSFVFLWMSSSIFRRREKRHERLTIDKRRYENELKSAIIK
jgi:hypothetical protein